MVCGLENAAIEQREGGEGESFVAKLDTRRRRGSLPLQFHLDDAVSAHEIEEILKCEGRNSGLKISETTIPRQVK